MTVTIIKKGIMQPRRKHSGTNVEWTEETWNPFVGCSIHTAGCTNCYAMKDAYIKGFNPKLPQYHGVAHKVNGHAVWTGKLALNSVNVLNKPFTWKETRMVFVNSMSDFFHANAPDQWRLMALKVMAETPHQYQVLTKRPEEIQSFLDRTGVYLTPNVWIGATFERADFKHRIDLIRAMPVPNRFLSLEPLLGPMEDLDLTGIQWVIAGGESGKGARPMAADWVREIRDACSEQVVPFFFKQWGVVENNPLFHEAPASVSGARWVERHDWGAHGGNLLDGVRWNEFPKFHYPHVAKAS